MFTECIIRFVDCDEGEYVVIKEEEYDEAVDGAYDDWVFYYGLSTEQLIEACKNGTVIDEWVVEEVIGAFDALDNELMDV